MTKFKKHPYAAATNIYLCFFILYLLWFDSAGLTAISAAKRYGFYTISSLYIASVFIILFTEVIRGKRTISDFTHFFKRISLTQGLIAAYLFFTLISALLSPYRESVLLGASRCEGLLTISFYCIGFFLISCFARPKKWMLWLLSSVVIIFCTIGILQRLNLNPFSLYPSARSAYDYSHSFLSTVGNIDYVASFLCIVIPIFWVTILRTTGRQRFLLMIPLLFSLLILSLIRVAAGFVGILCGALFSLPVVIPAEKKTRRIIGGCIIALILLAVSILIFFDFSNQILHEVHEVLNGNFEDEFGSGRVLIWKRVLKKIPERFWFGHGPDTMSLAGVPNIDTVNAKNVVIRTKRIDVAHNEYLNILFHQGIFALLAYLAALFTALRKWLQHARSNPLASAFGAAVLAYAIQAFFGISQLITAPFFWCALALLENSIRYENRPSC